MADKSLPELNPIIHSRIRLAIMSVLISSKSVDFKFLKKSTDTTDGNLSTHLAKLEQANFVKIKKEFKDKRPLTSISMSEKGRIAFFEYITALEKLLPKSK
jgi:DNA-binding MarR family transcriptional regulator